MAILNSSMASLRAGGLEKSTNSFWEVDVGGRSKPTVDWAKESKMMEGAKEVAARSQYNPVLRAQQSVRRGEEKFPPPRRQLSKTFNRESIDIDSILAGGMEQRRRGEGLAEQRRKGEGLEEQRRRWEGLAEQRRRGEGLVEHRNRGEGLVKLQRREGLGEQWRREEGLGEHWRREEGLGMQWRRGEGLNEQQKGEGYVISISFDERCLLHCTCTHLASHMFTLYINFQGSHLGQAQPKTFHLRQGLHSSAVLPLASTLLPAQLW